MVCLLLCSIVFVHVCWLFCLCSVSVFVCCVCVHAFGLFQCCFGLVCSCLNDLFVALFNYFCSCLLVVWFVLGLCVCLCVVSSRCVLACLPSLFGMAGFVCIWLGMTCFHVMFVCLVLHFLVVLFVFCPLVCDVCVAYCPLFAVVWICVVPIFILHVPFRFACLRVRWCLCACCFVLLIACLV